MSAELIASIVALLGAVTAFIKSHTDKNSIQEARAESRKSYDERFSLLELRVDNAEKRLEEGNDKFAAFERELRETNGMLRELIGLLKGKGVQV